MPCYAYEDVYVLFQDQPAGLFIVHVTTIYDNRMKTMVGPQDTVKVSEMPPS
jgi:hypothetical protein